MINQNNISEINQRFQNMQPQAILQEVLGSTGNLCLSFSGAEDVALLAMALKIRKDIAVFTLDTGRLHPETYRFIDQVRDKYALNLTVLSPQASALEKLTREKGLFSFYRDGHEECCAIRKTEPLRRHLQSFDGWITGQRKDQSPTRALVPVAQIDDTFAGREKILLKFNPLANWSSADVWNYIRMFDIPFNPLHERGFVSIGCEPCTRPVGPNQHEREGRWWWEADHAKECGLHKSNAIRL
jgi:phosphoadenosine phosphosulfate reductase